MLEERILSIDGYPVRAITVELPKTRLVILSTRRGYVMCGALDVDVLNGLLADREVIAARAFGVRTYDDLLQKPLHDVTDAAAKLGIRAGMTGREMLQRLIALEAAERAEADVVAADDASSPAAGVSDANWSGVNQSDDV